MHEILSRSGPDRLDSQEQAKLRLPIIEYDKSFLDPNCPYQVSVDLQGCGQVLEAAGIKREDVGGMTVEIRRNSLFPGIMGDYNHRKKD